MTPSDKARRLARLHPDWGPTRLAKATGLSRQGVARALSREHPGQLGRPVKDPEAKVERLQAELKRARKAIRATDLATKIVSGLNTGR